MPFSCEFQTPRFLAAVWSKTLAPSDLLVLLATVFSLAMSPTAIAQEPQITAELNTNRIYVGEAVVYSVMVSNVEDPPEPDLSHFVGLDVTLLGQSSQNSSSISIINGVRTDTRRFGKLFRYSLTPSTVGTITVPAPEVEINGDVLTGPPLELVVQGASEQESVFLNTVISPTDSIYPTQQFTVALQVDVRRLTGALAARSPLSIQDTVQLKIPWLTDTPIPNCTPESEAVDVLRPMLNQGRQQDGFGINGLSVEARTFFSRARAAQFIPPHEDVTRKLKDGTTADFVRYTIKQNFQADRPGEIKIPAATLKGLFAIPNVAAIEGQEVFAVSHIATLNVSNVPTKGRPNTYTGGIGSFSVNATVTPQDAQVGDPMTLTVDVTGQGTLDLMLAPDLNKTEGFQDRFRIYEPTSKSTPDRRTFTFTLRPETDDITEIAPIPFTFFDVVQGQYSTVHTAAIPLTITKAKTLGVNEVVSDHLGQPRQGIPSALQQNKDSLASNHVSLAAAQTNWLTWKQWLLLWGLIVVAAASLKTLMTAGRNRNSDPVAVKRRQAVSNAHSALQTVQANSSELGAVPAEAFAKIVIGLVADSTGQQAAGMTSTETIATLAGLGITSDIQNQTTNFLQDCDAARFGASNDDQERLRKQCQDLVGTLSKELKS